MYGLYAITNFIWIIGLYLSSATDCIVEQNYKLDFISDTAGAIGKNIQIIAGISENGFSNEGFYVGFLLSGIMIFSQILFIIYSVFLPIAFLFSLLPGFGNMGKKAVEKLFNTIMLRAGISIVISLTFSISAMIYSLTKDKSFFIIAFLQVVCFAGIYLKFGDIMSMFSLQSNESRSLGRSILKKPYIMISSKARQAKANIGKNKKDTVKTADYAKGESSKNLILSSNKNAHIREKINIINTIY